MMGAFGITRRQFLSKSAAAGTGALFTNDMFSRGAHRSTKFFQDGIPATPVPGTTQVGQAYAPIWNFIVQSMEDPYPGKLIFPAKVPSDSRVVRAETIIVNSSDQPLNFQGASIHLLDSDGIEYVAGNAQGSEPKIVSQVLPPGERLRGSVWFVVPANATLVELRYYAPSPELRVELPGS